MSTSLKEQSSLRHKEVRSLKGLRIAKKWFFKFFCPRWKKLNANNLVIPLVQWSACSSLYQCFFLTVLRMTVGLAAFNFFERGLKNIFLFLLCAVPLSCYRFLRTIHNNVSTYIPFQQVIYVILDNDMTNRCDWCNTIQREQPIFFTYGYDAMSNIINHLRSWLGLNVCLFVFLTLWTTNI